MAERDAMARGLQTNIAAWKADPKNAQSEEDGFKKIVAQVGGNPNVELGPYLDVLYSP